MSERFRKATQDHKTLFTRERPWLRPINRNIEGAYELHRLMECRMECKCVHGCGVCFPPDPRTFPIHRRIRHNDFASFFMKKNEDTIEEITKIVTKLRIVKGMKAFP